MDCGGAARPPGAAGAAGGRIKAPKGPGHRTRPTTRARADGTHDDGHGRPGADARRVTPPPRRAASLPGGASPAASPRSPSGASPMVAVRCVPHGRRPVCPGSALKLVNRLVGIAIFLNFAPVHSDLHMVKIPNRWLRKFPPKVAAVPASMPESGAKSVKQSKKSNKDG